MNKLNLIILISVVLLVGCNFFDSKSKKIHELAIDGKIAFDNKKFNEATQIYLEAIKIDPTIKNAYSNLGIISVYSQKYDSAIYFLNKAIWLGGTADDYFYRAAAKEKLNRFREAIKDYDTTILLNPQYYKAYYFRGVCSRLTGNYVGVISDCKTVIEHDSSSEMNLLSLLLIGISQGSLNNYDSAILYFNKVISLNPVYPDAYSNRAAIYLLRNQPSDALRDYNMAIRYNARNGLYFKQRGIAYYALNKKDSACLDFQQAYKLGEPNSKGYIDSICGKSSFPYTGTQIKNPHF